MKTKVLIALLLLSVSAMAQGVTSFLVTSWFERGNQMCKYDNGTVLNMGAKLCPLSIKG